MKQPVLAGGGHAHVHALAAWGDLGIYGARVWRWKDGIDRRFIARFGS